MRIAASRQKGSFLTEAYTPLLRQAYPCLNEKKYEEQTKKPDGLVSTSGFAYSYFAFSAGAGSVGASKVFSFFLVSCFFSSVGQSVAALRTS